MESPATVTHAVQLLQRQGYDGDFRLRGDGIECRACGTRHMPDFLEVEHTYRFEGMTDPADESIVLGVRCTDCEARGIVVSAYGPEAEPELFELLRRLAP